MQRATYRPPIRGGGAGTKITKPVLVTKIETGVCVEYSSMTKAA